ncbi:MAG: hypothetical protein MRY21_02275 [Simkaniaceae bacterium]|nr:hypothetical protein [Simkaniaceae bacterium]
MATEFRIAPLDIIGVYPGEAPQVSPEKPLAKTRAMMAERIDGWIDTLGADRGSKKLLRKVLSNVEHIDFGAFEARLNYCVHNFLDSIEEGSEFLALVEPGKSQTWVTQLARHHGLAPTAAVRMGEKSADSLQYALGVLNASSPMVETLKGPSNIVILDDGAFTGKQMSDNIKAANTIFRRIYGARAEPHFHVIVPYVTEVARVRIEGLRTEGVKLTLHYSKIMPTLSTLFQSKADKSLLPGLLGVGKERLDSTALTYFDHKIPNSMSFPQVIAGSGLIPDHPEPYKDCEAAAGAGA